MLSTSILSKAGILRIKRILPSLQDNLSNTVLKPLACVAQAAGFNIGGIPHSGADPGIDNPNRLNEQSKDCSNY